MISFVFSSLRAPSNSNGPIEPAISPLYCPTSYFTLVLPLGWGRKTNNQWSCSFISTRMLATMEERHLFLPGHLANASFWVSHSCIGSPFLVLYIVKIPICILILRSHLKKWATGYSLSTSVYPEAAFKCLSFRFSLILDFFELHLIT